MTKRSCRLIGVVSDTHGLMRPQALAALRGAELIIHAGDIGSPDVLDALRGVASVVAIRGNVDRAPWANALAETEVVDLNGALIYVLHNIQALDLDPQAAGFRAVVFGHSHKSLVEQREDVLYLNPGSIGPRRFTLPITLARLQMDGSTLNAEIVNLKV
ncbi:MAG: metallophosphatase family protein [Pseudomonadota bacterium]|nr:metallophosphatase family protein [Pseudomonadota bacterium]